MNQHVAAEGGASRRVAALLPLAVAIVVALIPAPAGLAQSAWYFFAIFAGVIAGLIAEPLPAPAIGLAGVTIVTVLSKWVFYTPEELARPGFSAANNSINWALSGFSNSTVWLVFSAFMFALGYEKTGLGRRIALLLVKAMGHNTLMLGYAIAIADTVLAPFTPSNTARSAGTIFPIVRNLPELYGSKPNDPSARKIGGFIMWTAFATTGITSSLFLTGLAPNLLAVEIIKKTTGVEIGWLDWFIAAAPFGIVMLLLLPLLIYLIYPPEIKTSEEVSAWAAEELKKQGPFSTNEKILSVLVFAAISMWIFGASAINATTAALVVVTLMIMTRVVDWEGFIGNKAAWNTLVLLSTLVTLADGLARVGFIKWFDETVAVHMHGYSPVITLIVLVSVYFIGHYMFASITAHTTAMLPVMLGVGMGITGMPITQLAMLLALTHGVMGVITPYATGPAPVYYGAGYIPAKDFWRLGAIFGAIFLVALLGISGTIILAAH